MNCKDISGLLSEYVDGNLKKPIEDQFEAHVENCPRCEAQLNQTREMVSSLSRLGTRNCPVDCWTAVRGRIAVADPAGIAWWHWVLRPVFAAPAALVVAVLALFLFWPAANVPMVSDKQFAPEYSYYLGAHSHLQRRQAFVDRDMVFARAELQKATLVSDAEEE